MYIYTWPVQDTTLGSGHLATKWYYDVSACNTDSDTVGGTQRCSHSHQGDKGLLRDRQLAINRYQDTSAYISNKHPHSTSCLSCGNCCGQVRAISNRKLPPTSVSGRTYAQYTCSPWFIYYTYPECTIQAVRPKACSACFAVHCMSRAMNGGTQSYMEDSSRNTNNNYMEHNGLNPVTCRQCTLAMHTHTRARTCAKYTLHT